MNVISNKKNIFDSCYHGGFRSLCLKILLGGGLYRKNDKYMGGYVQGGLFDLLNNQCQKRGKRKTPYYTQFIVERNRKVS